MKTKLTKVLPMALYYIYIFSIVPIAQTVYKYAVGYQAVAAIGWLVDIAIMLPCAISVITRKISFAELGYSKKNIVKQVIIGIAIFVVEFVIFAIIPMAFGVDKNDLLGDPVPSAGILIMEIFATLTLVGLTEEFIFRGYFYSKIASLTGSELAAVFLSAVLFGLWHFPVSFSVIQTICATLSGLVFGFARYKIKNCSVLSVSIAHWLHDSTVLIVSFVLLSPK